MRIYCPRAKGAHKLAERSVTPQGPRVTAAVPMPGRAGYTITERTFTENDLADEWDGDTRPLEQFVIPVGCRCGRFTLDVAALLHGEAAKVRPSPMTREEERQFGLDPRRARAD